MLKITTSLRVFLSLTKPQKTSLEVIQSKQEMLEKVAQSINIKLKPTALLEDQEHQISRLTLQQKKQLGLYIPQSPFNHRLSRRAQKQYLKTITTQLYGLQESWPARLKILQDNFDPPKGLTLDHYINLIYKDVYARYLIGKGIGIEWQGFYAHTGVVNPHMPQEHSFQEKYEQSYSVLLDFIQSQAHLIKKTKTIGLFCCETQLFVHPKDIEIERIKRLGYYVKVQLTEFGQYEVEFRGLREKNGKAEIVVFVEHLQKLINPNAICLKSNEMYLMLKRYVKNDEGAVVPEYLMVSKHVHSLHEKFFKNQGYQKHSVVNSKHLIGMKAQNLPLVAQIQGYERAQGSYILHSGLHMADYQRAITHGIDHSETPMNQNGQLIIKGQPTSLSILNLSHIKQLQTRMAQEGWNFLQFYDVFEDQVYYHSQTKRVLKFKLTDKYSIPLGSNNAQAILQAFKNQGTVVSQSKIQIPSFPQGKKPRFRRAFRKQRKQMLQQKTEHYSLQQSLAEITSIGISSASPTQFQTYLIRKEDRVMEYERVLTEKQLEKMSSGVMEQTTKERLQSQGYTLEKININDNLAASLLYLSNMSTSKDRLNILIEPQSQTEDLIPYALHLNYLINYRKLTRRKTTAFKNGIHLIKLHPTLEEKQRNRQVRSLLEGVVKSNHKEQYAMGLQALRLWAAKNDNYVGDRSISQNDINQQLPQINSIRKVFWDLLPLLPPGTAAQHTTTPQLYISKFMMDTIDCYIVQMEQCYKELNLRKAYELTTDYFRNIVDEIYVKSVKKRIIAYPNHPQNEEHFRVIRRIMELLPVISPLFPFSAFHISRQQLLQWPKITSQKFYESLPRHNDMIRMRVQITNKLLLNRLTHAQMHLPSLEEHFTERDLQLFFNVDKMSTTQRPSQSYRQCSLDLHRNNPLSTERKVIFYVSEDHCIRCDSKSSQRSHLCSSCHDYLTEEIGEGLKYYLGDGNYNRRNDVV